MKIIELGKRDTLKCELGACARRAEYAVTFSGLSPRENLNLCGACLRELERAARFTRKRQEAAALAAARAAAQTEPPEVGHADTQTEPPEVGDADVQAESPEMGHADVQTESPEVGHADVQTEAPKVGHADVQTVVPKVGHVKEGEEDGHAGA